jgi:hypothetical protein
MTFFQTWGANGLHHLTFEGHEVEPDDVCDKRWTGRKTNKLNVQSGCIAGTALHPDAVGRCFKVTACTHDQRGTCRIDTRGTRMGGW